LLTVSNKPPVNTADPRILIVRVGAMGDVLHGMPAVAALRDALPNAHIAWAIEPRWAPLLQVSQQSIARTAAMPLVDRVHLVPAKQWSTKPFSIATLQSIATLRSELRAEHYDIAIDLQGTIRSSVIARMGGAPRVIGSDNPREAAARWLYNERVALTTNHVVEHAVQLVSHAIGVPRWPFPVPLPVDPDSERWANTILTPLQQTVVLAPTAGWGAKQWLAERFGALAHALTQRGYRVLVNAALEGTDSVADQVVAASGRTATAVPCTLPQLIALLRGSRLLIAGDSGPLHLAAALGIAVVALFGPTDPQRNGPWIAASRVLRHPSSITDHHRHAQVDSGLAQITVDEVESAAVQLLQPTGMPPP
jgi:heptosyltransferase-1